MAATRGYIGPLGDDFPAIFPIAMGLLLFFSAITLTYDYYNTKHDAALLLEANTALAKAARAQLVFTQDYWDEEGGVCDLIDKTKANYGVRAKAELLQFERLGPTKYDFNKIRKIDGKTLGDNPCVDYEDDDRNPLPYEGDFFISLTYPILLKSGNGQEIATLVVTTWM
ncbi:MAG: hypothetical protein KAW41_04505 [Candidatus Diapherotrites archaeon]|nr:hypothetical protein [Candidatus Diapherotrites archaeon]